MSGSRLDKSSELALNWTLCVDFKYPYSASHCSHAGLFFAAESDNVEYLKIIRRFIT